MMIQFDHIEPPVIPDRNPNRPPPMPPAPAPDVVPVRDPMRPEHPDPVKEPPTHEPPIATSTRRDARQRLRAIALHRVCRRSRHVRNDWSAKHERQYEHIKQSLREDGKGTKLAEEIATRTVTKERAQHGEAKEPSAASINDISGGRRGGLRSHSGAAGRTLAQLRNEASQRGLTGRWKMNKARLESALKR